MTFHHVAVLGSARDSFPIAEELRAAGMAVETWFLPDDCSGREAATLAELAAVDGAWAGRLANTEITITAFRDGQVLSEAVVPYVLPHLPIGSLWLQMGEVTLDERVSLADAAAEYDIGFLHAPLVRQARVNPLLFASSMAHPRETRGHQPLELLTPWQYDLLPAREFPADRENSPLAGSLITRQDPGWDGIGTARQRRRAAKGDHSNSRTVRADEYPASQTCTAGGSATETTAALQVCTYGPGISGGGVVHHHVAPP